MSENRYFNKPTQVVFYNVDGDNWKSGIAYCDEIICAHCGGVIEIDEIYKFAPAEIAQPIFPYNNWCDITDDIIGDEMPEAWQEIYEPIEEEGSEYECYFYENLQDKKS